MSSIPFTKMQALGNDFVVVDSTDHLREWPKHVVQRMSHRHTGIGFDQLLILEKPQQPNTEFHWRIFNTDGSEAAQCGNGARAIARFIVEKKLATGNTFRVSTAQRVITLIYHAPDKISVDMGVPHFAVLPSELLAEFPTVRFFDHTINVGNPHVLCWVENVETAPVEQIGSILTRHPVFPEGTNVEFAHVKNRHEILLRVFERGVGETAACGSGACAAMVAARRQGLVEAAAEVVQAGGSLHVKWEGEGAAIWQTGSAETVFEGVWWWQ